MTNAVACAPDPGGAVVAFRNSDDFYPKKPESHLRHVRYNAASSLWTGGFAPLPDWDMFHSRHDFAAYHAAARAVSGGPIYVSDAVGDFDVELLRRLVDGDGRALRFDGPAMPRSTYTGRGRS